MRFIAQPQTEGERNLSKAIGTMISKSSLWGCIFGRLTRKEVPRMGTFGVGFSKRGTLFLLYDPEILENTPRKDLEYVMQHEGMHLVNNHIPRSLRLMNEEEADDLTGQIEQKMKKQVWNIASDCAANDQLDFPEKINLGGKECPAQFPHMYELERNYPTEYYYYEIMKQSPDPEEIKNKLLDAHKWEVDENGDPIDGDGEGEEEGEGKSKAEKAKEREKIARNIENNTRRLINKAYNDVRKGRGTIPGNIAEMIEEWLKGPKLPYYDMIAKLVRGSRLSKYKTAHNRTNKKRTHMFVTGNGKNSILPFPGRKRDVSFKIGMLIDTSGSQSLEDISEALSGIQNIIEKDSHSKVFVVECDTEVNKEYEVNKISDIDCEISGRGGTILEPGLRRLRDLHCDVNLIFTDGMCDNINTMDKNILPRKRIIWVISPNGTQEFVDRTGVVVWIDPEDKND